MESKQRQVACDTNINLKQKKLLKRPWQPQGMSRRQREVWACARLDRPRAVCWTAGIPFCCHNNAYTAASHRSKACRVSIATLILKLGGNWTFIIVLLVLSSLILLFPVRWRFISNETLRKTPMEQSQILKECVKQEEVDETANPQLSKVGALEPPALGHEEEPVLAGKAPCWWGQTHTLVELQYHFSEVLSLDFFCVCAIY